MATTTKLVELFNADTTIAALSTQAFVEAAYENLLGLSGTFSNKDARVAYWVAKVDAGLSKTDFASTFLTAAAVKGTLLTDAEFATNTATLSTLAALSETGLTLAAVKSAAAGSTSAGTTGSTFTLTQGVDAVTGTAGNDSINAYMDGGSATYSNLDVIDGGAGTDTLTAFGQSGTLDFTKVTNVERFIVQATGAATVDMDTSASEAYVEVQNATATMAFNDIGSASVDLAVTGGTATTATFNYKEGLFAGTADAINLNLNSVISTVTITSDDTANIETLNINSTGGASTLAALTAVTGLATVNVAGSANLNLEATQFANTVTTINASTFTGNLAVDVAAGGNLTFTGGSGNDTLDMATGLTSADGAINGGAGTDTLVLGAAVTAANAVDVVNFEELAFDATGITQDADAFSAINTYATDAAIAALVLSNVKDDATFNMKHSMATSLTANLKTNTASDNITVNIGGTTGGVTAASLILDTNYETIVVNSQGSAANVVTTIGSAVNNMTFTGSTALTVTGTGTLTGVADFSAMTAGATVTTATSALTVTGGSAADTLASGVIGAGVTQVFNGGAGNDTITSGNLAATAVMTVNGDAGNDTITFAAANTGASVHNVNGGAGFDTIVLGTHAATVDTVISTVTAVADADKVTGFVTGTDKFDYNGTVKNDAATTITAVSNATLAGGLAADADATVYIVSTALTGAAATDMTALVAETTASGVATKFATFAASFVASLGTVTGLDNTLSTTESVLLNVDDGTNSVVLRVTNTDTTVANTLTAAEVELVGIMVTADDLVVADFI